MSAIPVVVRTADAEDIRPLRIAVLRPGQPLNPSDYDLLPATRHVAAFAGDVVVGCASVFPSPYEEVAGAPSPEALRAPSPEALRAPSPEALRAPSPEALRAWQLRGMAVAADHRGTGLGAQILLGAIDLVRVAAAPLLWANARVSALGFYERLGFKIVGDEFTYGPLELPHKVIVLPLDEG